MRLLAEWHWFGKSNQQGTPIRVIQIIFLHPQCLLLETHHELTSFLTFIVTNRSRMQKEESESVENWRSRKSSALRRSNNLRHFGQMAKTRWYWFDISLQDGRLTIRVLGRLMWMLALIKHVPIFRMATMYQNCFVTMRKQTLIWFFTPSSNKGFQKL